MRVVVVGCGYVGLELARQLAERGHAVTGVRRSDAGLDAIESVGEAVDGGRDLGEVDAVRADATDPASLDALPEADTVVFAASSGGRGAAAAREVYVDGLRNVIEAYGSRVETPDRLIYTSSTGVYGDHDGAWVDEETPIEPTTDKTRVLAAAERIALETAAEFGIDGRLHGLRGCTARTATGLSATSMDRSQPDTSTWSTATTPPGRSGTSSKRTVLAATPSSSSTTSRSTSTRSRTGWPTRAACGAGEAVESGSDRER